MEESTKEKVRTDCWNKAIDAAGYYYIYSQKIKSIEKWLKFSKIMGIILPVFLGGMLSTYSAYPDLITFSLWITSPLAVIQLVLSAVLTVKGSDENLVKYSSMAAEYSILDEALRRLGRYPIEDEIDYKNQFDILMERERGIGKGNLSVTDGEKRMGMRYALREQSRKCAGCKMVPVSMHPTNCDVCGNF